MKIERFERGTKHARAQIKLRDADFSVKALKEDGTLTGYGSVFGVVDSYNEVVAAGAFAESLKERAAKGRGLPILWQHRSSEPLGLWTVVAEDEHGLKLDGKLLKDDVRQAAEAYALLKNGVISGLSIGYWVRESSYDEREGIRTLTKLDLEEVSLVTFPANDDARVDAVKFKLSHGTLPTLREFERVLRDEGFSQAQAKTIASHGYAAMLQRDAAGDEGEAALAKKLAEIAGEAGALKLPEIG